MKPINGSLVDLLFGCWHRNLSFPLSVKQSQPRSPSTWRTGTYVVCLDCGKEFAYDWQDMRIVKESSLRHLMERLLHRWPRAKHRDC
jgi:hypothetical protein